MNGWPLVAEGVVGGVLVGWMFWRLPLVWRSGVRSARRAWRRWYMRRVGWL